MTKLEKLIHDAIPFDGAFSEIVKGESAKAIAIKENKVFTPNTEI